MHTGNRYMTYILVYQFFLASIYATSAYRRDTYIAAMLVLSFLIGFSAEVRFENYKFLSFGLPAGE
jgi:general stress protein CsbA